jgi:hypothetical protein
MGFAAGGAAVAGASAVPAEPRLQALVAAAMPAVVVAMKPRRESVATSGRSWSESFMADPRWRTA